MADPNEPQRDVDTADYEPLRPETAGGSRTDEPETQPAEEWGERLDTGKTIARGGKEHGRVPGAHEQDR